MEKSKFNNEVYYWIIISIIILLLTYNLYLTIVYNYLIGLLPVTIQSILLFLILKKNKFAKIGIKLWAWIFLIIAYGLQFIGHLLKDVVVSFVNFDLIFYIKTGIGVSVGFLIFIYANKTIEIVEVNENGNY